MKFVVYFLVLLLAYQGEAQRQCYVCENCRTMPQNIERTTCANAATTTEITTTTTLPPIPPVIMSEDDKKDSVSEHTEEDGPILVRQRRQEDPWQCFEIEIRVGDTDIHNRGCVQRTATDENTCAAANQGVNPQYCRLCDSDGCNSASIASLSIIMLISSFVLALNSL